MAKKPRGFNGGALMSTSLVVVAWSDRNHQIFCYVSFEQGLHEGIMRTFKTEYMYQVGFMMYV